MKHIIYYTTILFCWSWLLGSAEKCIDPIISHPTAIQSNLHLIQNINAEDVYSTRDIHISLRKFHHKGECKDSKLVMLNLPKRINVLITRNYFLDDKTVIICNDSSAYEIKREEYFVTRRDQLRGSFQNDTCSGIYDKNENLTVVEFVETHIVIDYDSRFVDKTDTKSYIFSKVPVYTLSKSPLVQYALLADKDHFLALHLKVPYSVNSTWIKTDFDAVINFNVYTSSLAVRTPEELLRKYGTFPETTLKWMKDHCEFTIFQKNLKIERESLKKQVDYLAIVITVIIIFYTIFLTLSCSLNYWSFRRIRKMRGDIKKIEDLVPVTHVICNNPESPYEYSYIECLDNKMTLDSDYDIVTVKKSKAQKKKSSGYLTPVNSIRGKPSNYVNLENINSFPRNSETKQGI